MGVLMKSTFRRRQARAAVSADTGNARRNRNRRLVRRACEAQGDGVAGGQWAGCGWPVGLMMELMSLAPLANERAQPRRLDHERYRLLQPEPRRRLAQVPDCCGAHPRHDGTIPSPVSSQPQPLAGRLVCDRGAIRGP